MSEVGKNRNSLDMGVGLLLSYIPLDFKENIQ